MHMYEIFKLTSQPEYVLRCLIIDFSLRFKHHIKNSEILQIIEIQDLDFFNCLMLFNDIHDI